MKALARGFRKSGEFRDSIVISAVRNERIRFLCALQGPEESF